jgi:hypothetical protein
VRGAGHGALRPQPHRRWDDASHPDLQGVPSKPTPNRTAADRYEIEQTGPRNYRFDGGGEHVWADGYRGADRAVLDAKHVGKPDSSPFVPDSGIPPPIRDKILTKVEDEFRRYGAVINDPGSTPRSLEVVTNDPRAVPYFESLLEKYGIPGHVVVRP